VLPVTASLHTGYDTGYLTDAVGAGKAGVDYYTGEAGEPPGYWQGGGATALGLAGAIGGQDAAGKASAAVMRRLYHEDIGPDGQVLARRQRPGKYQAAGGSLDAQIEAEIKRRVDALGAYVQPEEVRAIALQVRAKLGRNRVPFYDLTYSPPKSVSVLWASLRAASAEAEAAGDQAEAERLAEQAEQVRGAVKRANDRMIAVAERESAYVRTGHHSATSGEYRDGAGLIVASFPQHTNRDGDPQLHVHNAIANRVQRADGADEKWRSLHAHPLFRLKIRLGTLGDRFLGQELEELGWRSARREDGKVLEVAGISDEAAAAFSRRAREVQAMTRELAAAYEAKHGHAPGKQALFKIKQEAALRTRDSKDHDPPRGEEEVTAWTRHAERSGAGALGSLHQAAAGAAAERAPSELPSAAERARLIRRAVAGAQAANATFDRAQLTLELGLVLPPLPAGTDPQEYIDGLVAEAVSGRAEGVNVLQVAPGPDVIDVTRLGLRQDGTSIYRPPGEERFCTAEHRDNEQYLVDSARIPVPRRITAEAAAAALEGTDLDPSQRAACLGLLTAGRLISCLVAPAGTGKTHVMAAYARIWDAQRAGRVIGLTASTNAARVMADEAQEAGAPMITANIARFLGKIKDSDQTRGHMPVYPGDVLVVDEATQVSTEDALRIVQVARQCGATVVGTFDPAQLGSVDAGGIFPLIAARYGFFQLTEVRRFRNAWERNASLRLRDGQVDVLAEYAARGRAWHGPQDRVYDEAVMLWLSDYLRGRETLLLAASNEEAAALAKLARERLAELGRVGPGEITLADGNAAGRHDLVRARLNTRIDADGQTLANRDVIRIEGLAGTGTGRLAVVTRQTGPDSWSKPFFVQAAYLEQSAELAYAGNVHVSQGRTVDRAHLVASEGMTRDQLYVGMTRGREENTLHVTSGRPDPAQMTRAQRQAYSAEALSRARALREAGDTEAARKVQIHPPHLPTEQQSAPWEAVVAQIMQRADPEGTALEQIQAAQDRATNTGYLLQISEAFWRLDVVPQIDAMVAARVTPGEYQRYLTDPERPSFLQALREHEIGGREIPDVLDAITAEPLTGLRSIAAGLHGRLGKEPAPARGATTAWADRAARAGSPEITAASEMMDARQAELGRQTAERPPLWALEAWGVPPAEGAVRAEWERRAGIVASYRETAGVTDPAAAIGPPPAGTAQIREAFLAAAHALALADDQAAMRAMGRGQLEALVDEADRAAAAALPDVQADTGVTQAAWRHSAAQADIALGTGDTTAAAEHEAQAEGYAGELARLSVADAARREWAEANAAKLTAGREGAAELRRRGLAARLIPVTDAEWAEASAAERDTPPMGPEKWARLKAEQTAEVEAAKQARREAGAAAGARRDTTPIDPEKWARWKAEQQAENQAAREAQRTARAEGAAAGDHVDPALWEQWKAEQAAEREARQAARAEAQAEAPAGTQVDMAWWERARAEQAAGQQAEREARREASARAMPVTDAEITRYGTGAQARYEAQAAELHGIYAEMAENLQAISEGIRELSGQMDAGDAQRERDLEEYLQGPSPWQVQAQARAEAERAAEASWQPGEHGDDHQAEADFEAEI
jgi:conjugative relaxase-like TrwC/TraI family protein